MLRLKKVNAPYHLPAERFSSDVNPFLNCSIANSGVNLTETAAINTNLERCIKQLKPLMCDATI
jgi:hypothetical protein